MTRHIGTLALMMLAMFWAPAWAAFDPATLGKSTVRITIKEGERVRSAASGFAWQDPTHIVTSLHVVHHGADAEVVVEFAGRSRRAHVIGVLPKADLVLLELERPIEGLVPLTHYRGAKPPYKAPITALGYNSGASGSMTRELHKGHADPEVLKGLLPPKDRIELAAIKIPDIELEIYYLDGSLLPGFSGSPVVDADGELVGIGNGGLENGASNVSWVIPARFLDELTASGVTTLPAELGKAQQSFSADLEVTEDYQEIVFDDFVFVKTKTRSFAELASSSDSPSDLREVGQLASELGYVVDLDPLEFDIYEDLNNGIIITLPKGIDLLVGADDQGSPALQADYFGQHDDSYSITFYLAPLEEVVDPGEDIELALNGIADFFLEYINESHAVHLVEIEDVREIEFFGGDKYILRTLFHDFDGAVDSHEMDYVTIATNLEYMFVAQGELDRFDTYFEPLRLAHLGTDCRAQDLDSEQQEVCAEMRVMLQILTSVHLTTFANAQTVDAGAQPVPASVEPQDVLPGVDPGPVTEGLPNYCCTAVGVLGPYANPGPNGPWPLGSACYGTAADGMAYQGEACYGGAPSGTAEELPNYCCTAVGVLGPYANPGPNGPWPLGSACYGTAADGLVYQGAACYGAPEPSFVEELPHYCCTVVGALGPYSNPGPDGVPLPEGSACSGMAADGLVYQGAACYGNLPPSAATMSAVPNYCCTAVGRFGPYPNDGWPEGSACWSNTPSGQMQGLVCY